MAWYTTTGSNTSSNSTTTYYTISYNTNYGYSNWNTTGNYKSKTIQDFKNKEMKHMLDKERGW